MFVVVVLLSSCGGKSLTSKRLNSEVDFSVGESILLNYDGDVYNITLKFQKNSVFEIAFCDNAPDGLHNVKANVSGGNCILSLSDITYSVKSASLPQRFLPLVLYSFFDENNITADSFVYDEDKNLWSFSATALDSFVEMTCEKSLDDSDISYSVTVN